MTSHRTLLSWKPALRVADSDRATLLTLAVIAGVLAGLGAVAFRWLVDAATYVFTGTDDYAGVTGHPPHGFLPWLGPWFVVLAPVVGGLIYGPLVYRYAREARGHGVPEVMYAVQKKGGRIPGRVAFVKAIASAVTIGSGGSVGREGPIVQIGAALGSTLGRLARIPGGNLRLLVACGAAGGIAATFNAPIAGVFFALELLLGSFAVGSFTAVVLSTVTASIIARTIMGNEAFLVLPEFTVHAGVEYLLFAVLGIVAGAVGVIFMKVLYWFEDMADKIWRGPEWLRPAVGGIFLGLLLLAVPQMYGVGYPVLENAVVGEYLIPFLILMLVAKVIATSLTIAIGGSGGVFAPSLFLGAMLGAAVGQIIDIVMPNLGISPGAYAVIGMAAVFAGSARAPITAVLILFELTGEYSLILPLMLGVVVATLTSSLLSKETIYTMKLSRRGIDLHHHSNTSELDSALVQDLMVEAASPLRAEDPALPAARTLLTDEYASKSVVTSEGIYVGVVTTAGAARMVVDAEDADTLNVSDMMQWRAHLEPHMTASAALDTMIEEGAQDGLAVLDDHGSVTGWLRYDTLLTVVGRPR